MDQTVIAAFDAGREERRLLALRNLALLDSAPEREFDALAALASEMLGCPIAALTVIDRDRQWFKARYGVEVQQTPRDAAFCAYTIREPQPFVVPDATRDERFFDNPLVCGPPHIRFYAGAPLVLPDGWIVGSLCLIDSVPRNARTFDATLLEALRDLVVEELLEHARTADRRAADAACPTAARSVRDADAALLDALRRGGYGCLARNRNES